MKHTKKLVTAACTAALTLSMTGMSAFAADNTAATIQQMIDSMTTEQKVEQMMMIALRPWVSSTEDGKTEAVTTLSDSQREFIEKHNFCGVCLYAPNLENTEQCITFTDELQQAALASDCGIPMLISADQEGGKIYRLPTGTTTSGNMALGATAAPQFAYENARILGNEIKALGINTDLAPVLDVNNNPSNPIINLRSFSSDPELVSKMGVQYIKGLQSEGIVTTVKHFPGHGNTSTDSHTGLPMIDKSYDELQKMELYPYSAAVEAGPDMIMTAHIQFPQVETGTYISKSTGEEIHLPATLSKTFITDILRGDYHYDGVVITDSMVMKALDDHFDIVDSATMAINADVDILLEPITLQSDADLDKMEAYITDIVEQVEAGSISISTIDKSVNRILTMKQERGILDYEKPDTANALQTVGSAAHREKALEIAEQGVTLVKNAEDTLPLKLGENGKVAYFCAYENVEKTMQFALDRLKADGVVAQGVTADCTCYNGHTAAEYEELIRNSDAVILEVEMYSISNLRASDTARGWQAAFADDLIALAHKNGKKVVYVSAHIPYDVARFQEADAIVAAYCANGMEELPVDGQENPAYGVNLPAALITIFGGNTPNGKLPIDIYTFDADTKYTDQLLYPRGFGMTYKPKEYLTIEELLHDSYQEICRAAKRAYLQTTGKRATNAAYALSEDNQTCTITLTDETGNVLDVYTISSTAQNCVRQDGTIVDLGSYLLPSVDESEYFVPWSSIGNVADAYYLAQEANAGKNAGYGDRRSLNGTSYIQINIRNKEQQLLETYVVDLRTGIGADSSGKPVDLGAFVKAHPESLEDPVIVPEPEYYADFETLGNMAKIDYEKKYGTAVYVTDLTLSGDGSTLSVTLTNADGETMDVYEIDPFTGSGTASSGQAVELPQTGNNSAGTAAAAAGALALSITGLFAAVRSGFLRRKHQD